MTFAAGQRDHFHRMRKRSGQHGLARNRAAGKWARRPSAGCPRRAQYHAVETTAEQLRDLFGFDVQFIPVDGCGQVKPDDIAAAIRKDTALVSVMLANNEVGSINDVSAIGKICKERGVPFHTDAVQAPAYLALDVNALNCDALSMSSHKIYGPKGVGRFVSARG